MQYAQVSELLRQLRAQVLETGRPARINFPDGNIWVEYLRTGNDWRYEINGVRFCLRDFEQALTLANLENGTKVEVKRQNGGKENGGIQQ